MSNHFYKFLAKKVQEYFNTATLHPGDKYHIQFDREEQVKGLIEQLQELSEAIIFSYRTPAGGHFETLCLDIQGLQVIVASTLENTTPDFLTNLRNKVGTEEESFANTAILLVHNSNLDSLVHGMISFAKEGMPFHLQSIERDLKELMNHSPLKEMEKKIINFVMDVKKAEQTYQEKITLFDYTSLLQVLEKGSLDLQDCNHFGLFNDPELEEMKLPPKQLRERLRDNYELYEKVETFHKYGTLEELDKLFDDDGIKLLGGEQWQEQPYSKVEKSHKNKLIEEQTEYQEPNKKFTDEKLPYWERPDGESKAKQRVRHIIIFNTERLEELTLDLPFTDYMSKHVPELTGRGKAESSGKRIRLHLEHEIGYTNFFKVTVKTPAKYVFHIASVECPEGWLAPFQTTYRIIDQHIQYSSEETEWILNPSDLEEAVEVVEIIGDEERDIFEVMEDQQLVIQKRLVDQDDDQEFINFRVLLPYTEIPLALYEATERPAPINGLHVWKLKREKQQHFKYRLENDKMKILQGTKETYAQNEFRANLDRELKIIKQGGLYFREDSADLEVVELNIPETVEEAYKALVKYFDVHQLLPSLAYMDAEYEGLASRFVHAYLDELMKLEPGQSLTQQQRNLAYVGTIERVFGDREWLFTPLHPLNLAYQLQIKDVLGEESVGDELLKILRSTNLLPYVKVDEKVYRPVEKSDSPEWGVYVDHLLPRYGGSRSFVSKLVKEKMEEFIEHFGFLFNLNEAAPIKINLINMGDCREVLHGIFEFYKKNISQKISKNDILKIELFIYAEKGTGNVFEEMSQFDHVDEISEQFGLNLKVDGYRPEELLNLFREKVHFYTRDVNETKYEYAHIAFYQMSKIEQTATSNMSEIETGLSLFGLVSGVPSVFINGDYKTGFGRKFYPKKDSSLLALVPKLNAFLTVARTLSNYQDDSCLVTAISVEHKQKLDRVYDSAHWVTFVEPRVDLSFFKNDSDKKDLLVIHYSDHSSPSNFDAVTVTRRSKQYQQLIEDFLQSNGTEVQADTTLHVINMFNALNGNWLLRLLAQKNHFSKEKISILSAVKLSLAMLSHPNIVWLPISMEEVLRISGGTGLKQSEGLFSAKNLGHSGSYSDDLLFIGVEQLGERLQVHFYPIEVKIGNNNASMKEKALKQVKQSSELLRKFLQDENQFRSKMYRNFFMQLAIVSAEKMQMYGIWPEQNWASVTDSDIRERLLNDDYHIENRLEQHIGRGAFISFQRDVHFINVKMEEDTLVIEQPEGNGYALLLKDIEQYKVHIQSDKGDIPASMLLANNYRPEIEETLEIAYALSQGKGVKNARDGLLHEYEFDELSVPVGEEDKNQKLQESGEHQDHEPESSVETRIRKPMQILFGNEERSGQEVLWYPTSTDKVMHTNTGIIGTMGTGKTQFTKSLITQLKRNSVDNVNSTPIGILIFDYKGDYIKDDFVAATKAKVFHSLYHLPFNPLALYVTQPIRPMLPMHTCDTLVDTISTAFNLGQVQRRTLKQIIMDAYAARGIDKTIPSTWELPAPTFRDVYELYLEKEDTKVDSLLAALETLSDYEVFEPNADSTVPLFDMIEGVTVINLSGFPESVQNLVVAITLDVFYSQMQISGHSTVDGNLREITRMILVDEADNFLSKDFKSIKKILKEGREFGVGTILSTQFMDHFSTADNEYSNYILTWIVHNVAEMSARDIKMIFNAQSKAEEENIQSKIHGLAKHYSLVKGIGKQPICIRDKAFWEIS
ncbi:DNA phosphorothioation-dependent restriction protein DptH [Brevibacillus dissolubilis]|uniref:DNA phosphorothioation-dependent restriction protein DptH n=1 Tax=Brevibacillus dissolubilis TaxID=1844116 RepID=UPI001C3F19E2|nr:DNA phosphorothioation-dependent restriction protein DptH [Brevibacillus dissolubilis]